MNEPHEVVEFLADSLSIGIGTDNKRHAIQRLIQRYRDYFSKWGTLRSYNPKNSGCVGRPSKTYLLNLQQASALILMMDNNSQTTVFKERYVDSFTNLETHLSNHCSNNEFLTVKAITQGGDIAFITTQEMKIKLYVRLMANFNENEEIDINIPKNELEIWERLFGHILDGRHEETETVVYVLLLDNHTVKIGVTQNPLKRFNAISSGSGLAVKRFWYTPKMTKSDALLLESKSHKHFEQCNICGEFFETDFNIACEYVEGLLA